MELKDEVQSIDASKISAVQIDPSKIKLYNALSDEQQTAMSKAVQNLKDAITDCFYRMTPIIVDTVSRLIPVLVSAVESINNTLTTAYPNKRVVWLATHHPKARVRKKNMHRIMRELQKSINLTEDDDE